MQIFVTLLRTCGRSLPSSSWTLVVAGLLRGPGCCSPQCRNLGWEWGRWDSRCARPRRKTRLPRRTLSWRPGSKSSYGKEESNLNSYDTSTLLEQKAEVFSRWTRSRSYVLKGLQLASTWTLIGPHLMLRTIIEFIDLILFLRYQIA